MGERVSTGVDELGDGCGDVFLTELTEFFEVRLRRPSQRYQGRGFVTDREQY